MKKIFWLTAILILSVSARLHSEPFRFQGVYNDISPSENRIVYACKEKVDKAYSDGVFYLHDFVLNKTTEISRVKYMDYAMKAYFLDDNRIIVSTREEIFLYDIKAQKISKSIMKLERGFYFQSSRKDPTGYYFTLVKSGESKVDFIKLDSRRLKITTLKSSTVEIQPTDNFFNYYLIDKEIFFLNNGKLVKLNDSASVQVNHVAFNALKGNYMIAANSNSLCLFEQVDNRNQPMVISNSKKVPLPFDFSNEIRNKTWIEPVVMDGVEKFLIVAGLKNFVVDDTSAFSKSEGRIMFSGKKNTVVEIDRYELEVFARK